MVDGLLGFWVVGLLVGGGGGEGQGQGYGIDGMRVWVMGLIWGLWEHMGCECIAVWYGTGYVILCVMQVGVTCWVAYLFGHVIVFMGDVVCGDIISQL